MSLIRFELKNQLKSSFIWGFLILIVLIVFISFYPSFQSEAESFQVILTNFPQAMLKAMGLDVDTFVSFGGYFSYVFTYIILVVSIYGMNMGLTLIGREKLTKTTEFLHSKPVSRGFITGVKLVIGALNLLTMLVLVGAVIYILLKVFDVSSTNHVFEMFLSCCYLAMFFYLLGGLVATVLNKLKRTISISSSLVFLFFMMLLIARLSELDWLKKLTPFGYFELNEILLHGLSSTTHFGFLFVFLFMIVSIILLSQYRDVV